MKMNLHLLSQMRKASHKLLKQTPVDPAAIVKEALKQAGAFHPPSAKSAPDMLAELQRSMETMRGQFGGAFGDQFGGASQPAPSWPGSFTEGSHTTPAGTRHYKLYVPSTYEENGIAAPLVVMLHGCTQDPDDFAHGTGMNALA